MGVLRYPQLCPNSNPVIAQFIVEFSMSLKAQVYIERGLINVKRADFEPGKSVFYLMQANVIRKQIGKISKN